MTDNIDLKIDEIKVFANIIKDPVLKQKTIGLLNSTLFNESFRLSPAAKKVHHSYTGGLIDHTLSTTKIGLSISQQFDEIYGYKTDEDTVIAACLLHDLFKPYTYDKDDPTSNSPLGNYMDHLVMIVIKLTQNKFPFKVVHAVAAHHGDSGPVRPETLEAMIVHLADYIDSKLNGDILRKAKTIYQDEMKEGEEPNDILTALDIFAKRQVRIKSAEEEFNKLFDYEL
ncbi:MAG: HD domain-containing protein [Nitrososphaeria archaeon]|jgi:7,8-dihydroneopterin 2',3'-cyclic phosphate phosphodiesterase